MGPEAHSLSGVRGRHCGEGEEGDCRRPGVRLQSWPTSGRPRRGVVGFADVPGHQRVRRSVGRSVYRGALGPSGRIGLGHSPSLVATTPAKTSRSPLMGRSVSQDTDRAMRTAHLQRSAMATNPNLASTPGNQRSGRVTPRCANSASCPAVSSSRRAMIRSSSFSWMRMISSSARRLTS